MNSQSLTLASCRAKCSNTGDSLVIMMSRNSYQSGAVNEHDILSYSPHTQDKCIPVSLAACQQAIKMNNQCWQTYNSRWRSCWAVEGRTHAASSYQSSSI